MTQPVKFINDGRYYGVPKDSTVVWKKRTFSADSFDYEKIKARVAGLKESNNKQGLATITKNIKKVCTDNPGIFDEFLALVE